MLMVITDVYESWWSVRCIQNVHTFLALKKRSVKFVRLMWCYYTADDWHACATSWPHTVVLISDPPLSLPKDLAAIPPTSLTLASTSSVTAIVSTATMFLKNSCKTCRYLQPSVCLKRFKEDTKRSLFLSWSGVQWYKAFCYFPLSHQSEWGSDKWSNIKGKRWTWKRRIFYPANQRSYWNSGIYQE